MISEPFDHTAATPREMPLRTATGRTWDAIVIGAGPAGGTAAALLAARGWNVLLLERSAWPRDKVCGGCLNAAAVSQLQAAGLAAALRRSVPLRRTVLHVPGSRPATVALPGGAAIGRKEFDSALIDEFISRGGTFLSGVSASLMPVVGRTPTRTIEARQGARSVTLQARVMLACDGISGATLAREPWAAWQVRPRSLIGVAAVAPNVDLSRGDIHMSVGPHGYVGMTRFADDTTHLAAAIDPVACRAMGGPIASVRGIMVACGWSAFADWSPQHPRGTTWLTRQRANLAGHRVMAVGDACGYVEPFTGEGMAWAIAGACRAVKLLADPMTWPGDMPMRWKQLHSSTVGAQQHRCRVIRMALREPTVTRMGVNALRRMPWLASLVTHASTPVRRAEVTNIRNGGHT